MSQSSITIVGNVADVPQLRTTQQGKEVTRFVLASSRSWRGEDGWQSGETTYIDVDCWHRLAKNVVNTLSTGTRVMVQGRLETHSWVAAEGERRYRMKIVADSVGVDLRYATAKVRKNAKNGGDFGNAGTGGLSAVPGGGEGGGAGRGSLTAVRTDDGSAPMAGSDGDSAAPGGGGGHGGESGRDAGGDRGLVGAAAQSAADSGHGDGGYTDTGEPAF